MRLEGFRTVWNGQEKRWDYVDVDNQVIAYWDNQNERIEITATTLTEKHIGLFVPVSATEADSLFQSSLTEKADEFVFAFLVDLGKITGEFEITTRNPKGANILLVRVPVGTKVHCPFKTAVLKGRSITYGVDSLLLADMKKRISFVSIYTNDGLFDVVGEGEFVEVGSTLATITSPVGKVLYHEGYNIELTEAHGIDFGHIAKTSDGRLVYIR